MKIILLLLALAAPVAADSISSGASFVITGAMYSLDGTTFTDAASLSPVYVPPGTVEVVFVGSITNNDTTAGDYLYLNDQSAGIASTHLSLDTNYLFNNAPGTLDPHFTNDSFYYYSGGIFGIQLDPTTPSGTYTGTYTLLGGGTADTLDTVGSTQSFSIVVTPEPHVRITLAAGLGFMALLRRRAIFTSIRAL